MSNAVILILLVLVASILGILAMALLNAPAPFAGAVSALGVGAVTAIAQRIRR
jgi:uncharacterized membrane protein YccC